MVMALMYVFLWARPPKGDSCKPTNKEQTFSFWPPKVLFLE